MTGCSAAAGCTAGSGPRPSRSGTGCGRRHRARRDHRGRGALTDAAFALDGIERVEIHCDEANLRSAAVPRRLGYTLAEIRNKPPAGPPSGAGRWCGSGAGRRTTSRDDT